MFTVEVLLQLYTYLCSVALTANSETTHASIVASLDIGQRAALLEVLDSLADANRAITGADDSFASAVRHSRLP